MNSDLTFFTNEPGSTLLDRFLITLKDTKYFDVLVGYFRTSCFHRLYKSFESIDKIIILVGLIVDGNNYEIIEEATGSKLKANVTAHTNIDLEINHNMQATFSTIVASELNKS